MKKLMTLFVLMAFFAIQVAAATIAPQIIEWNDPNDLSVVKHRLYYCIETEDISYLSPNVEIAMPGLSYDLALIPIATNGENYKLRLTAWDGMGNESNFSPEKVFPLDNTPPMAPSWKE